MSRATTMTGPTEAFFEELSARGHEPKLAKVSGSVRFDLENGSGGKALERWHVTVVLGDITVSRRNAKADAVLHTYKELFDRFITGQTNPMAATLRGLVDLDGDPALLVLFQRLFTGRNR